MRKPRQDSIVDQVEALLEMIYLQDIPGLAVGTNSAARLAKIIWNKVSRDREANPGAWPGLHIIQCNNPMELFICRDPSASGSSER